MKSFPLPLRFSLPAILIFFTSLLGGISFQQEISNSYQRTEENKIQHLRLITTQTANTLNYLYRRGDIEEAEVIISQLGSDWQLHLVLATDENDRILISKDYTLRELLIKNTSAAIYQSRFAAIREKLAPEIFLTEDRNKAVAIYPFTLQQLPNELSPSRIGILLIEYDLIFEKQIAYNQVLERTIKTNIVLGIFCFGLWLFFHLSLTRRVARLVKITKGLADGDLNVRANFVGADELTQIATAFDGMVEKIQENTRVLSRQNAVLKAQQEVALDGILIVNENRKIVSYNQKYCEIWQVTSDLIETIDSPTLLKKVLSHLAHPEEFLSKVEYLYQHPEAISRDEILFKDGRILDRYSATVISPEKEIYGRIWYFRDITQSKQAEAALRASEQRFRDVSEAAGEYLWEIDADGIYTFVTERAKTVKGYTISELLGHSPFEFMPAEDIQSVQNILREAREKKIPFKLEHRDLQINGEVVWEEVNGIPLLNEEGKIIGFRGAGLSITERKRAEIDLRAAKSAAETANRAKSEFLANMSHEIRTPMNAILGFAQLLEMSLLDDEQREHLNSISTAGESLLAIVNDILDLSKLEVGELKLNSKEFDLPLTVKDCLKMFQPQAKDKGLELTLTIAADIPQWFYGPVERLRQVLTNLLRNAIKFTPTGKVSLRVTKQAEKSTTLTLYFQVEDTGIGIAPEDRERIFRSFTQVESSATRQYEGSGLGLAICQKIVNLMGGKIGVESTLGKGSQFWFTATMQPLSERNKLTAVVASDDLSFFTSNSRILLVEDNQTNQKLMWQILQTLGYGVDIVNNGQEALDILARSFYPIILMDCQMPVLDGYEATKKLRQRENAQSRAIVIGVTSHTMLGDREKCLDAGMNDYLSKPFKIRDLRNLLQKWSSLT